MRAISRSIVAIAALMAVHAYGQDTPDVVAHATATEPTLDGVMSPGEYDIADSVRVTFEEPGTRPGIIPVGMPRPTGDDDLSFAIFALFSDSDLFVAVRITDEELWADSPACVWCDDNVELLIDGRGVLQLGVTSGGVRDVGAGSPAVTVQDWDAQVGTWTRGWIAEYQIPLSLIDVGDEDGVQSPQSGDAFRFNLVVNDDDNGGQPYEAPDDSYGALSGSSRFWDVRNSANWGMLRLSAGVPATAVEVTSWGTLKANATD